MRLLVLIVFTATIIHGQAPPGQVCWYLEQNYQSEPRCYDEERLLYHFCLPINPCSAPQYRSVAIGFGIVRVELRTVHDDGVTRVSFLQNSQRRIQHPGELESFVFWTTPSPRPVRVPAPTPKPTPTTQIP